VLGGPNARFSGSTSSTAVTLNGRSFAGWPRRERCRFWRVWRPRQNRQESTWYQWNWYSHLLRSAIHGHHRSAEQTRESGTAHQSRFAFNGCPDPSGLCGVHPRVITRPAQAEPSRRSRREQRMSTAALRGSNPKIQFRWCELDGRSSLIRGYPDIAYCSSNGGNLSFQSSVGQQPPSSGLGYGTDTRSDCCR